MYRASLFTLLLAAAGGGMLLGGCRSRGELRDWVWRDRQTAFRIGALPPTWEKAPGRGDVEFHHPETDAVILANADCTRATDAPLTTLTNTLLIGFTDRRFMAQEPLELAGRAALRSRLTAKLDGVPVELMIYVLKKDQCAYDLIYAAPTERFAADLPTFERFVAGFGTLPRRDGDGG